MIRAGLPRKLDYTLNDSGGFGRFYVIRGITVGRFGRGAFPPGNVSVKKWAIWAGEGRVFLLSPLLCNISATKDKKLGYRPKGV